MSVTRVLLALAAALIAGSSCAAVSDQSGQTATPPAVPGSGAGGSASPDPVEPPVSDPSTSLPPSVPPSSTPTTPPSTVPTQDPQVSQILAAYATWSDPGFHSTDGRNLERKTWTEVGEDSGREQVTCAPSALPTVVRNLDEFPAFGFSGDNILPGLIVDGTAVTTGDIRVLPLERAPFMLRSSLASANPTTLVERPDSGTIAEAVATLKRDADPRLGGVDVTGGDITYRSTETHSFEQSSLEVGVSLRYRNRLASAGLDANYAQDSSTERHTITVQLAQRQFTLSMVDDAIAQPGDYFAPSVSPIQVENLVGAGQIGAANPPLTIDRVTYGRLMYFTMSSTSVNNSQELRAAVDAVKGRYEGSAQVDATHLEVINNSEISMVAYGGDQGLALDAIRTGDLSRFFGPSNPTTATPLTFTFQTLGGQTVALTESADVQRLNCQRVAAPYEFALRVDTVQGRLRVFVNSSEMLDVKDKNKLLKKIDGSADLQGATLNNLLQPGVNEIRLRYTNLGCDNRFRVRVFGGPTIPANESGLQATFSHPKPGCPSNGDMTMTFTLNTDDGSIKKS